MKSARVSRNIGAVHEDASIASTARLPVSGKIRPGVKVLTKAAAGNPALMQAYNDGVAAGVSFDEIASRLSKIKGVPSYPLTPKNVPYFTARQGDFATPGAAKTIMDLYGEVRHGDSERRLYAFPIVFSSDSLDLVFREQFEAWRASELHRWSEQDPGTGELMCMMRAETKPDPSKARRWGGRATVPERPCNPNDCGLFAKGECKHIGSLYFWVPGILGAGTIELTFTSVYASMGVAETIELVRAGLGRITGLHNGKPIFWVSKSHERVARMNWESGKPEKSDQWIIRLDATGVDMMEVLAGPVERIALPAPAVIPAGTVTAEDAEAMPPGKFQETPESIPPTMRPDIAMARAITDLRAQLGALRDTLGWTNEELLEWIAGQEYPVEHPAHHLGSLTDMVMKLNASAEAKKRREEGDGPAMEGEVMLAGDDDSGEPF